MTTKDTTVNAELLRAHGLKATSQRLQVLELLANTQKPLSITELQKNSGKEALDSVTLYRSLETLVEKSLVRPVDLRHGHTDYELVREGAHHHHIVCEKCGTIEDIEWCPEADLKNMILKKSANFASLTDHALEFFGLCKRCERKKS